MIQVVQKWNVYATSAEKQRSVSFLVSDNHLANVMGLLSKIEFPFEVAEISISIAKPVAAQNQGLIR